MFHSCAWTFFVNSVKFETDGRFLFSFFDIFKLQNILFKPKLLLFNRNVKIWEQEEKLYEKYFFWIVPRQQKVSMWALAQTR